MNNSRIDRRMAWIEAALRAGGKFPADAYREAFGISRQTTSDDLNEFAARLGELGISYERKYGELTADLPIEPIFKSTDPRQWVNDVKPNSVISVMAPRLTEVDDATLRVVLQAVREGVVIRCDYTSVTSGYKTVVLSPHTLVRAVGREHVRAFDHKENAYRDYILARMQSVTLDRNIPSVGIDQDVDWHRMVRICLKPVATLCPDRRHAILLGLDALEAGEKTFTCRAALANYTIQSLGFMPDSYISQVEVSFSYETGD